VKRQQNPAHCRRLLNAEINEKQARSIKYQLTIAKLPLAKDLEDFQFEGTPSTRPWSTISPAAASSPSTQCRFGWRDRHRQDHLAIAIAEAASDPVPRALLQRGRSRQPPGDRDPHGRQGRIAEH